jgi:L-fuconolactonase
VKIVDSHCHVSTAWYEPVESLLHQMDQNGVEQAVLVQLMGQFDNSYQTECLRRYPARFASVVLVDASLPHAVQQLEQHAAGGASGVRLQPTTRSQGDDPLAIWRAAERLGLAVSCSGRSTDFASPLFAETIQAVPGLPIVIEHLGSVNHPDGEPAPYPIRRQVFELARFPNVFLKVHGFGEFAQRRLPVSDSFPFEQPAPPLMDLAYAAFGPGRLMWGSDYPPVSGREGYRNALRLTVQHFETRSAEDQQLIFGGVAGSVFRTCAVTVDAGTPSR